MPAWTRRSLCDGAMEAGAGGEATAQGRLQTPELGAALQNRERAHLLFAVAHLVVICPGGHRRAGRLSLGWPTLQLEFLRLVAAAQVRPQLNYRGGGGSREVSL